MPSPKIKSCKLLLHSIGSERDVSRGCQGAGGDSSMLSIMTTPDGKCMLLVAQLIPPLLARVTASRLPTIPTLKRYV